ncbi:MAG: TonB family protein [Candidatus Omnitrophota bacterium]|jgi:protein TonB|nr:MAG: TonB family protein [Candidatus Omnitrophota bacterium]
MNDRTAFFASFALHIGLFLSLIITTWANYRIPQQFVPVELVPMEIEKQQPQPEPPQPEPLIEEKPDDKKPKLSEDAIQMMKDQLNKLKTPTKTPTPTKSPKPTVRPTISKPTVTPAPTRTPIPTLAATMIPLENLTQSSTPIPASQQAASTAENPYEIFIEGDSDYDFSSYKGTINRLLQRAWRPPTALPPERRDHIAVVSFTIYRDGTTANIEMESSSGWALLDQTVREAVKRASPLEALPQTYSSGRIRVRVPFILPAK